MTNLIVEYTVGASAELEDNYRWIKERSEISAEKWLNDLIHEIEALSQHPLKHSIAPESPKFPV
jgi:plasmid stabilization system protein ParE